MEQRLLRRRILGPACWDQCRGRTRYTTCGYSRRELLGEATIFVDALLSFIFCQC